MASDVKLATQYAVENNNPQSFKNISEEPALAEENFSSRNVNPEYISRYQATENATTSEDGVVYFDEGAQDQNTTGNINAYDNYSAAGEQSGSSSPNVNFNFGMGFGYSPYGWGMSPYMGMSYGMGFMPGLSIGIGFGFGYPMYPSYGYGYPMYPMYPSYGYGYPMYPMYPGYGYPVYPGYPSYVLPGGEYGDRRVVYGARPTRGSSITNTGIRATEAGVMPSTARAQARGNTAAVNSSARRLVSSENTRGATRDFSSSQNDYYNSSRSRVATTRNTNSPATDRAVNTRSRSTIPSARPSVNSSGDAIRNYASPSRGSNPSINNRTSSPSYNRGTVPSYNRNTTPSYNNRSTSPSYNRGTTPSYNRSVTPSRSNDNTSTFSAPSRTSTGGGSSFSTPSRSSGGSSGGSVGGSRGGRGN
ncbi:hypothetical protein B0E43_14735 [Algoriphagus sp. A40]|nr:hypothetical protein B0E43_14735 [Algoriphagus sp. A40]